MEYYLYPPFLIIEPQTSFDKAWEDLCRQLLNLEHQTGEIRRRTPPDLGADLIWDSEGIVYQCKAIENGQTGSVHIGKVKTSIDKAKQYQTELGWSKYVLCTNVNITGRQEQTLRGYLPEIEFLGRGYWTDLCKKFHDQVGDRFRIPVQVSLQDATQAINKAYLRSYAQRFHESTSSPSLFLLVYSKRRNQVFELPMSPNFSVEDVLLLLQELFELPGPKEYKDIDVSVSLSYSLSINNKEVSPQKKLNELVSDEMPLVTLWKIIIWCEQHRKIETYSLEQRAQLFEGWTKVENQQLHSVLKIAVERYENEVEKALNTFEARLKHLE